MAGCIRVFLELLLTKRHLNPPLSDALHLGRGVLDGEIRMKRAAMEYLVNHCAACHHGDMASRDWLRVMEATVHVYRDCARFKGEVGELQAAVDRTLARQHREMLEGRTELAQPLARMIGEEHGFLAPVHALRLPDLQVAHGREFVDQPAAGAIPAQAVHAVGQDQVGDRGLVVLGGQDQSRREIDVFHVLEKQRISG